MIWAHAWEVCSFDASTKPNHSSTRSLVKSDATLGLQGFDLLGCRASDQCKPFACLIRVLQLRHSGDRKITPRFRETCLQCQLQINMPWVPTIILNTWKAKAL